MSHEVTLVPVEHKPTHQSHPSTSREPDNTYMHHGHEHHRPSQKDTKYVSMLLALDDIPRLHNMMASFFTWILLAGFVLFPGTFTSLQNSETAASSEVGRQVLKAVAHVPLFVIAFLCCGIGAVGMCYLWWKWMDNYLWLVSSIFMYEHLQLIRKRVTADFTYYLKGLASLIPWLALYQPSRASLEPSMEIFQRPERSPL
ncbi:hypothetical protein H2248_003208 [Termitomyces sp. 'cryptogamus']|nr:hypothetical protein H2248_003208 [Termitomyces sp. 'cryptogamus']